MKALRLRRTTGATVTVLAYAGMTGFEVGIVTEVFGLPRPELDVDWYDLKICAEHPGDQMRLVGGVTLTADNGLDVFASGQTVIVPGVSDVYADCSPELVDALRLAHRRGARIVSICSGAFALAAAGLLDNRRVATHWRYAAHLQQRYPSIKVDADVLYVDDGDVLTSAGSAAGLDLCLHLVQADFGAAVANKVARRLVIPPHRDGGQAQFIETPVAEDLGDHRIAQSMSWALAHLDQQVTVQTMAAQVHMSTRTYLRHFKHRSGTSPIRWLINQRIQASLQLLEATGTTIEDVATAVGFENAVSFRRHFSAAMRTSPTAYRRALRTTNDGGC
jgi:AraC family transcriptional regulator, transcriptional activator FtrA